MSLAPQIKIGIIADDLTSAADGGAPFARENRGWLKWPHPRLR